MRYVREYLDLIGSGEIQAPKKVIKAYRGILDDIGDPNGKYRYDSARGERPIRFIEGFCRHSKGEWAGSPVRLCLFQKAFISTLFGVVEKGTGLRRFRQAFFEVGRKNGKTTMLAGIALYMMVADGENGAEVYALATKREQAKIIFDVAYNMVQQSPDLKGALRKRRTDLYFPARMAKFEALSKESRTLDGLNASCAIIDELHAVRDRNLYEVMQQSMAARREPLLVMITTAGTLRENVFDDIYSYANGVVDGTIDDDTFLPVVYELDDVSEWRDPQMWQKANPGLGEIKKRRDLEDKVRRAKQDPASLTGLLTKDFNVRDTPQHAWLDFSVIDSDETFSLGDFRGSYFIGGADLSSVNDLTCATALLYDKARERYCVEQMYWIPRSTMSEHLQKDKVPYDIWERKGLLRVCDTEVVDYSNVTGWFMSLVRDYGISPLAVYYDRWQSSYWAPEMESMGFPMVPCAQGAKTMSVPMKHLQADLRGKKVAYNGNPILKWCLSNTDIITDVNENIRPVKASPHMRIDGAVSLINAYVGLIEHYSEFRGLG